MITIIVDNQNEYDDMKEFALNYMCRRVPFGVCGGYKANTCDTCYEDNHIRAGIRIIAPETLGGES